jgi:hypothetical protein
MLVAAHTAPPSGAACTAISCFSLDRDGRQWHAFSLKERLFGFRDVGVPSLTRVLSAPTKENLLIIRVTIDSGWHFFGLPSARPHPAPKDVGMFYIHADPPKSLPPIPVRVSRRSQLTAALRQHARPIVIEDQELAGPFVRLLRARQLRLWGLGEFVANTMSCGIDQSYGANVEAHWYVGRYVLPGNVQKVILKPKPYGAGRLPRHLQA